MNSIQKQDPIVKTDEGVDFSVRTCNHQIRENHRHDCIEMVYVINGTASHTLRRPDGTVDNTALVPGSYFFLDSTAYHAFHNGSVDFEVVNFLFQPALIDKRLFAGSTFESIIRHPFIGFEYSMLSAAPVNNVFYDEDGRIRVMFEFALEAVESPSPGRRELMRCLAIQILITALQRIIKGTTVRHKNATISGICEYVDAHYSEHITLTQICRDRYFSIPYISKRFKEVMGISFEQYLQQVRVHNAANLLVETSLSIDIIAQRVGYTDTNSFRNVFRKTTGQNPAKFRSIYTK